MKVKLFIEAHANACFYCEGRVISPEAVKGKADGMLIKLGNQAIADLITGAFPCQVELPDNEILAGNIQKSESENLFIISIKR